MSPSPPLVTTPGSITLPPGGTGGVTVTGPGPFTATGCPGIINGTVNGNVVNLVAVGVGVCAVVITGPGGVQTIVVATVTASTPLAVNPGTIALGTGGTGAVAITGTGPFTATGCPGIVNATVTGNVLSLAAVGVGVCVVVVTDANGVKATVIATVTATTPLAVTPPTITLGPGGTGSVVVTGTGPFTATGCPGIINATVSGNVVNLAAVAAGVCVIVVTGPNGLQATVLATVSATAPPITVNPTTVQLAPGGSAGVTVSGTGPFTATGCPGIINATVTGNVVNLVGVGLGVCAVVVTGPGGIKATVVATVSASTPLSLTPTTIGLLPGGTGSIAVTGTGPFAATGCPGIINATVTGNVVNLAAVGVGVCAVIVAGPSGVHATVVATVSAATPLTLTPTSINLGPGGTGSVAVTGTGPFTATGCPGIVNATVNGNVVNLAGVGVGVCVVVVTGPNGVTATVLATVAATPGISLVPTAVQLGTGATSAVAITGTGPFTATGCPGIINATVTGNVLNLASLGVGVCAVVVIGPGGVKATVLATVTVATPLVATPATVNLLTVGSTAPIAVTPPGSGPFTASGCPGIVNATVTANIVNVTSTGIGVCAVVITGAGGIQATALVTVT